MNKPMKIKVSRLALLKAITAKRDAKKASVKSEMAQHEVAMTAFRKAAVAALEASIKKLKSGKDLEVERYGDTKLLIKVGVNRPSKPEFCSRSYDQVINVLNLSMETTIEISADDYAKYLE